MYVRVCAFALPVVLKSKGFVVGGVVVGAVFGVVVGQGASFRPIFPPASQTAVIQVPLPSCVL